MNKKVFEKKKLISLSAEMSARISSYCAEHNIESETEFIRFAIAAFFENQIKDENLILQSVKNLQGSVKQLFDAQTILFSYTRKMHESILLYHAELDESVKSAALLSAERRNKMFFNAFKNDLQKESSFFESLLHGYFKESGDGAA
jgi:hypothetical protein